MPTNDLTMDKLLAVMRQFPPPARDPIDDLLCFKPRMLGMDVYVEPPPPPKIQVRDIKLSDGTSILSPEFLARENQWWLERFGHHEPLCKDKMYFFGSHRLLVNRQQYAGIISNLGA